MNSYFSKGIDSQIGINSVAHYVVTNKHSMSQDSSHSFSQPTITNTSDFTNNEDFRHQAKYNEYLTRNRHLELLDLLHDIKRRVIDLEEKMQNTEINLKDTLNQTRKNEEVRSQEVLFNLKFTEEKLEQLYFQIEAKEQKSIELLKNFTLNINNNLETISRKLDQFEQIEPESPPDLSLSVEEYLEKILKTKNKGEKTGKLRKIMNQLEMKYSEIDLSNELFNSNIPFLSKSQQEKDFPDDITIDSHMTDPILLP